MAVRSKRLFGPEPISTPSEIVYTCPDGETALLKCLTSFNQSALTQTTVVSINAAGGNANIFSFQTAAGLSTVLVDLFVVLHPADTLRAQTNQGIATLTGFGAELEGVAD